MIAQASAPAKVILFGEHAVVFDQPAIAAPVSSLRATATVRRLPEGSGLHIRADDLSATLPANVESAVLDHALMVAARLTLRALAAPPPDFVVELESDIPIASGLGSGAAVSTALIRALAHALGHPLAEADLNDLVYEVEKLHHGTPSGIDNTVVVYERHVYFQRGRPIESIAIASPFTLLVGDTGERALTHVAVGDVRQLMNTEPARVRPLIRRIGAVVLGARAAIETGKVDALGPLMCENHELLQQLTVSAPSLDRLVAAAMRAGALGAKMSGGGRGGNMIALVTPETVAPVHAALLGAGAARIFVTTVS